MVPASLRSAVQLALISSPYCSTCPANRLCGERDTARGCRPEGPPHPHLLHPARADWLDRFAEINGCDFDDVRARDQRIPALPRYVPRTRLNSEAIGAEVGAVMVSLAEVERLARQVRRTSRPAKAILGLPEGGLLLVSGFENDALLERAWPPERRRAIVAALREIEPDLAVAWGYSVWQRHARGWVYPRIEQFVNQKRTLLIYQLMQNWDIPSVPYIAWGDQTDIERWGWWLADNPAVSTIAIDLQTADTPFDWQQALAGLAALRAAARPGTRALINGPCLPHRIREVAAVWPDLTLTNYGALFATLFPHKPMKGLGAAWTTNPSCDRKAVFGQAATEYCNFLTRPVLPRPARLRNLVTDGWDPPAAMSEPGGTFGPVTEELAPLTGVQSVVGDRLRRN